MAQSSRRGKVVIQRRGEQRSRGASHAATSAAAVGKTRSRGESHAATSGAAVGKISRGNGGGGGGGAATAMESAVAKTSQARLRRSQARVREGGRLRGGALWHSAMEAARERWQVAKLRGASHAATSAAAVGKTRSRGERHAATSGAAVGKISRGNGGAGGGGGGAAAAMESAVAKTLQARRRRSQA